MRVIVDQELCEGNAVCMRVNPEVFVVRDDDKAHLLMTDPPESLRPKVEVAVQRCPRQAIKIEG